ncbi:transposase family protein [Chromobacterium amazonense]|uniref:transposase family protein n=1 Tax=Chromobacterium amazonense TaxID=1382803 RepID=UPI000D0384E2|nr:transposase family protein [Chromobacterium amazonense]
MAAALTVVENGIPSRSTFNRVFRLLDPNQFENAFFCWKQGRLSSFQQIVTGLGLAMR